jgi:hypothetical protein
MVSYASGRIDEMTKIEVLRDITSIVLEPSYSTIELGLTLDRCSMTEFPISPAGLLQARLSCYFI